MTVLDSTQWMRLPSYKAKKRVIPIFLGGSVQGASNWQEEFIRKLHAASAIVISDIEVFNPRVDNYTPQQADIEADALEQCRHRGVLLFFLEGSSTSYTTLLEIGESLKDMTSRQNVLIVLEPGGVDTALRTASVMNFARTRSSADKVRIGTLDTLLEMLLEKIELIEESRD